MDRITQEAYQRQRILKWAEKKRVTAAAIRYKVSRKTVYKWRKRYDGTLESLKERSRAAPHSPQADGGGTGAGHALCEAIWRRLAVGVREGARERIQQELRLLQANSFTAVTAGEKAPEAKEQAVSAGGIPRAEDSDRREVCAVVLRSRRREVLPVYGKGRMYALDIPGDVR